MDINLTKNMIHSGRWRLWQTLDFLAGGAARREERNKSVQHEKDRRFLIQHSGENSAKGLSKHLSFTVNICPGAQCGYSSTNVAKHSTIR